MMLNRIRAFLSSLLLLMFLCCQKEGNGSPNNEPAVIFPDGFAVSVTLAKTEMERARGLMFVPFLEDNRGMLFLAGHESQNPFWMKNCLIPLDIIWLDNTGLIVDISPDLKPCENDPCPNYYPDAPYIKVLEVRGNLSREHNLKVGDKLVIIGAD